MENEIVITKALKETLYTHKDFDLEKSRDYFLRVLEEHFDKSSIDLTQVSNEAGSVLWGFVRDPKEFEVDKEFSDAIFLAEDLHYYVTLREEGRNESTNPLDKYIDSIKRYYEANKDKIKRRVIK